MLMVSYKMIHMAFRTHKTIYKQNPLEEIFIFTIYQNYCIGGFEWIVINKKKSASFSLQTSENNLILSTSL